MTQQEREKEFLTIALHMLKNEKQPHNFCLDTPQENEKDKQNANALINNITDIPHAFVLGCVMDAMIKAEYAWMAPYKIFNALLAEKIIKNCSINELEKVPLSKYVSLFEDKSLKLRIRYIKKAAQRFYDAVQLIKCKYHFDASKIWSDKPSSCDVVERFREFNGIGQKISTMAVNILVRSFKVKLADKEAIDISVDRHVMRVMKRLGFVKCNSNEGILKKDIIGKARQMYSQYPGIFDRPCFDTGRCYCSDKTPRCKNCSLNKICKKVGV
ncbi:hypothetical protein AGMMS4956_19840 [Bacteroidia bacterium]|nr:hypothetical protein AGMMS4956_19840 [Bacteroidia bacterium]